MTDRDDWLAWRRGGIGGSDIAGVLGISPWASPWSVWADKCGLLPPQPEDEYMAAGRWLERAIGPWFEDETGLFVTGEQVWVTAKAHDWMRCTPDGVVVEDTAAHIDDALGGLEIKVTGPGRRWDEVPAYHQAQGQWQMMCTGWERVWFAVLMGRRLDIHELERDEADQALMYEAAEEFWNDHVLAGQPPPIDGHDATLRALSELYPTATPKSSVPIDDVAAALPMLAEAKAARKRAESDEDAASAVLRWAMKDNYEGTIGGQRAVTLGSQTRKTTCQHCGHEDTSAPFRVLRPVKGFA